MPEHRLAAPTGRRISLPGHFDVPVILEDTRALGPDGTGGYEYRVRLPDSTLDEAVLSAEEAATAIVLPGADTAAQLTALMDELDPNILRQSELAAEDLVVAARFFEIPAETGMAVGWQAGAET